MTNLFFPLLKGSFSDISGMKGAKTYLYCRVAQDDSFTLELQKEELMRFAERAGLLVCGVAGEYESGHSLERNALKEVSQAVCDGQVDVVLVKSSSRISRNMEQLKKYIDFLNGHNVALYCMQEQLGFGVPDFPKLPIADGENLSDRP